MLLTIDIRNTSVSLGLFKLLPIDDAAKAAKSNENNQKADTALTYANSIEPDFSVCIYADREKSADEYASVIKNVLSMNISRTVKRPLEEVSVIMLSSVAPSLTDVITAALEKLVQAKIATVGPGIKTMLDIKIDNPAQLAPDIVSNSVAADFLFNKTAVIIDIGFATTVSVLLKNTNTPVLLKNARQNSSDAHNFTDETTVQQTAVSRSRGCFIGSIIAPGVISAHKSLINNAELITNVQLSSQAKNNVINKNTDDAVRSGAIFGNAFFIDGCIGRISEETGILAEEFDIVATGEYADLIIPYCRSNVKIDKNLTHKGMYLLYKYNQKFFKT